MSARIVPAQPPFAPEIQARLDRLTPPGTSPLVLFTTLARDPRLFERFMGGGLLDRGHLALRDREIAILRTTARGGSEYEWGVHVAFFGERAGFDDAHVRAIVHDGPDAALWSPAERAILRLCDAVFEGTTIDDARWSDLRAHFTEEAVLELLLLTGFYRTVSVLTGVLRLPLEPGAARFPT